MKKPKPPRSTFRLKEGAFPKKCAGCGNKTGVQIGGSTCEKCGGFFCEQCLNSDEDYQAGNHRCKYCEGGENTIFRRVKNVLKLQKKILIIITLPIYFIVLMGAAIILLLGQGSLQKEERKPLRWLLANIWLLPYRLTKFRLVHLFKKAEYKQGEEEWWR